MCLLDVPIELALFRPLERPLKIQERYDAEGNVVGDVYFILNLVP